MLSDHDKVIDRLKNVNVLASVPVINNDIGLSASRPMYELQVTYNTVCVYIPLITNTEKWLVVH